MLPTAPIDRAVATAFVQRQGPRRPAIAVLGVSLIACAGTDGAGGEVDLAALAIESLSQIDGEIELEGLQDEVEVIRDPWGVPHIYAGNQHDLFFAQGFVAAQDRLWQMEMWRIWGQGRKAELEGPDRVESDRFARLLSYRGGPSEAETDSYHPEGRQILEAFVAGVNAFMERRADNLPVEFKLTGIHPEPWTLEVPVLRGAGVPTSELRLAIAVAELGVVEANRRASPDPFYELEVPTGLDIGVVDEAVIEALRGGTGRTVRPPLLPRFEAALGGSEATSDGPAGRPPGGGGPVVPAVPRLPALVPSSPWEALGFDELLVLELVDRLTGVPAEHRDQVGSNNWVVSGRLTESGSPMLANDPHRQVTNPSLRYLVHLNAPGWNVIGSGEPALPGVAIGHNERVAWGLTIVGTDQDDIYVEQLDPDDPGRVRWNGSWEALRVERETIRVRHTETVAGELRSRWDEVEVELEFSRHGPIFHKDTDRGVAYALRSFAQEPGTAPYLGSLRVDQAEDCVAFLDAQRYWKAPSENMICADLDGNIAWHASALTPRRDGWYGRLPVPGTGSYEWRGFRDDLPRELNPERGWIATANHNIQPEGFHPPIMFKSGPPYRRFERVAELLEAELASGEPFSIEDSRRLQLDAYSAAAAEAQSLFRGWEAEDADAEWARAAIAAWNCVFDRDSDAAALYFAWSRASDREAIATAGSADERRGLVEAGLRAAVDRLEQDLGPERSEWRWGRLNRATFEHPLVAEFDLPAVEKTGGAGTVYANGATYREIFDLADWDRALATTTPGQSGQPESPFYGDRLREWADGIYFPLLFSREAVDDNAAHRLVLKPPSR